MCTVARVRFSQDPHPLPLHPAHPWEAGAKVIQLSLEPPFRLHFCPALGTFEQKLLGPLRLELMGNLFFRVLLPSHQALTQGGWG